MARAWVSDLWIKDAVMTLADGSEVKVSPTSAELKSITNTPEKFRTAKFGRGKRWKVTWYEDVDGNRRQRGKLFDLKSDAEALRASLEEDIRVGRYLQPEDGERVFRDVAMLWLKSKRRIKDSTYFNYEKHVVSYILPQWGNKRIASIQRHHVEAWVSALQDGTAPVNFLESYNRPQRALGPSSLKNIVRTAFGSIMNFAVGQKWIAENVVKRVELPPMPGTPVLTTLTHDEVELMALAAEKVRGEYRDYVAIHMLAYSAPRINEMFALQKFHLNLTAARASIEQTWARSRDGGRKLGPPKNGDSRVTPIADHVVPLLKALVDGQPETAFVFRTTDTNMALWDRNWHNRVWTPAAKATKLNKKFAKFSPHVLRHTGITFAIAAGADIKIVQAMAGHRSIEETMNTYGKLFPDRLDEVQRLMSEHRARSMKPRLEIVSGTTLGQHDEPS